MPAANFCERKREREIGGERGGTGSERERERMGEGECAWWCAAQSSRVGKRESDVTTQFQHRNRRTGSHRKIILGPTILTNLNQNFDSSNFCRKKISEPKRKKKIPAIRFSVPRNFFFSERFGSHAIKAGGAAGHFSDDCMRDGLIKN